jgi:hypothetical protein
MSGVSSDSLFTISVGASLHRRLSGGRSHPWALLLSSGGLY